MTEVNFVLKLMFLLCIIFLVIFKWESIRKIVLPKFYYVWENAQKNKIEYLLKENNFLILNLTIFFTLVFICLLKLGLKPWYSVWVFVFGFLYILFKKANIQKGFRFLETVYLSVLKTSIIPTLVIARLVFVEALISLWEMLLALELVAPTQRGVVLATGILTAVVPLEGIKIFGTPAVKNLVFRPENNGIITVPKLFPKINLLPGSGSLDSSLTTKLNTFAMLEKGMHLGKLSNLVQFNQSYKYTTLLEPYVEKAEIISIDRDALILEYLNSSQVKRYCEYLHELRRTMDPDDFALELKFLLEQVQIPNLTPQEVKFIYTTILSKAATTELPSVLLEKEEVLLLFSKTYKEAKRGLWVVADIQRDLTDDLLSLKKFKSNVVDIAQKRINGDIFMKDMKEQLGLALKEKELSIKNLEIVGAERDPLVDYKVQVSSGEKILLECKSCVKGNLEKEMVKTFKKVQGPFEMFWENTETSDKKLFKVTKDGYQEIYKEAPEKK